MTTTVHKNLTGADLHEPKGADTALVNTVYVSNGAGSGSWVAASSIITNTAFTTGDLKLTHKASADTGWILWGNVSGNRTIGDGSSGATIRANADTSDLFSLYWQHYSNTLCPVSGGRGATPAADFAAHKTISIPAGAGRVLGVVGNPPDLTTNRNLGDILGGETITIITANLPAYTPSGSIANGTITFPNVNISSAAGGGNSFTFGGFSASVNETAALGPVQAASVFTGTAQGGTSTPISQYQPTTFVNVMIKL